jgi:hypothetical protein
MNAKKDPRFIRRNEDRVLDEREYVRKEEILAEDNQRMHSGAGHTIALVIRTVLWIVIIYVLFQILPNLFQ